MLLLMLLLLPPLTLPLSRLESQGNAAVSIMWLSRGSNIHSGGADRTASCKYSSIKTTSAEISNRMQLRISMGMLWLHS